MFWHGNDVMMISFWRWYDVLNDVISEITRFPSGNRHFRYVVPPSPIQCHVPTTNPCFFFFAHKTTQQSKNNIKKACVKRLRFFMKIYVNDVPPGPVQCHFALKNLEHGCETAHPRKRVLHQTLNGAWGYALKKTLSPTVWC